jgi:hypothetical protein
MYWFFLADTPVRGKKCIVIDNLYGNIGFFEKPGFPALFLPSFANDNPNVLLVNR